jgi:hypothetical protein
LEDDIEFHTPVTVARVEGVETMELCCGQCAAHPDCGLWVWGKKKHEPGFSNVCILKEFTSTRSLTKIERKGVVSGLVARRLSKYGWVADLTANNSHLAQAVPSPNETCKGSVNVSGYRPHPLQVVSAQWTKSGVRGHLVDVEDDQFVQPHLNSRGYLADNCSVDGLHGNRYAVMNLLGKTLKYTTDLSGAGCGCGAMFRLVPVLQRRLESKCSDHVCDSQDETCWPPCAGVVLQAANRYAWSSSLHVHNDSIGASTGFGGLARSTGWSGEAYHPGSDCIDTSWPFEVSVSFPVGPKGQLTALEVKLSQDGRSCPLAGHVHRYETPGGKDGLEELSRQLAEGMTPLLEYASSLDLRWLDGVDKDGVGPCIKDVPKACGEKVRFYGFSVTRVTAPARRAEGPREGFSEERSEENIFGQERSEVNVFGRALRIIHRTVAGQDREAKVRSAAALARGDKERKVRITYRDISSESGHGSCADSKAEVFDCWWGVLPFAECENQCSNVEACLGFDFQFDSDNCELRFSKGRTPVENPGPFNESWTDGLGKGNITGVVDDGTERKCYVKKLITGWQVEGRDLLMNTESYPSNQEWEVVYHGDDMRVRATPSLKGKVLAFKPSGAIMVGQRIRNSEGDWLKLAHEPGYMKMFLPDIGQMIRERRVTYVKVPNGTCASVGLYPIIDPITCEAAGFALGYFDSKVEMYRGVEPRPWGCYLKDGNLFVSFAQVPHGQKPVPGVEPLCASEDYATTTTTTTTTSTSSTRTTSSSTKTSSTSTTSTSTSTTSTTWGWPSFFCYEVVRVGSFEVDMVRAQLERRASIFQCEHYTVFSNGGVVTIGGGWNSTEIPAPEVSMGDLSKDGDTTNSWLNTMIFIKAWEMVKWDGRYIEHDWTIKVDPDAVFFPYRLRGRVAQYTPGDRDAGKKLFFMNCDLWNKIAMYGSLEIFSREALKTYYDEGERCTNELDWQGWGEDYFMEKCFALLGVGHVEDFQLIGDNRCHPAACSDTTKASFHDFKDVDGWFGCWEESMRAAGEPIPGDEEDGIRRTASMRRRRGS